jgi:hypothetical protein
LRGFWTLAKGLERIAAMSNYYDKLGQVALEAQNADLELAFERFKQAILIGDHAGAGSPDGEPIPQTPPEGHAGEVQGTEGENRFEDPAYALLTRIPKGLVEAFDSPAIIVLPAKIARLIFQMW